MTRDVVTADEHISHDDARKLLHAHRIEKLVIVDDNHHCIGLVTVKDMEKAKLILMRQKIIWPFAGRCRHWRR